MPQFNPNMPIGYQAQMGYPWQQPMYNPMQALQQMQQPMQQTQPMQQAPAMTRPTVHADIIEESGEYGRGYGYRDGYSQARSATTGRYMDSSNGYGAGYGEYRDGYGRGMYRDDGKEQVRQALQEAMRKAPDRQSRQAFEEAMRQF